jgi:peptide/nickel transport system substrate-binding protein
MRTRSRKLLVGAAVTALVAGCTSDETDPEDLGEIVPEMSLAYFASDFGATYEQSARVLADEFEQLGMRVNLEPIQFSTFVQEITVGGNLEDMALGSLGGDPDRLDPNFWVQAMAACESPRNVTNWCNEEYSELAAEQAQTLDEDEREALVYQAQEIFQEEAPWWQISHETNGLLWNNERWENVTSPAPVPAWETTLHPWLDIRPTGDDRILDWAHSEDLSTYNILTETASVGWLKLIYDPFITYDQSELVPWAAEDWSRIDDTTVELTLRQGMTFHDGQPVTADDAVFSINYMLQLQPPGMSDALASIAGAEKVDDLTFRVSLTQPDPAIFTQALTDLVILPQHIWEGVPDPLQWNPIDSGGVIGSGPFTFGSWTPNQEHVLGVHTAHWAAPDYDGIRRLALGQADAVRSAMVDGTADFASSVLPASAMERLSEEQDNLDFMEVETFNTIMVWVNHAREPFDDVEFRRAMRLATNKERVALEGWLGFATVAGEGNVPNALGHWHNDELDEIPYNMEEARQVLEDAGYGWDGDGRLHMPKA